MNNFLPKQYSFAHEYCYFLHDILARIVVEGEQKHIFDYRFALKIPNHAKQIAGKTGEELASWMEGHGYESELSEVYRRHICVALLSDYCHFLYEALECSQKGKLTVTFALLRKPLKENLFYFEWLLADQIDFLNRFHSPINPAKKLRPLPLPTELPKQDRLRIIEKAIKKSGFGPWISPQFIYDLRYSKSCDYGLEVLFQKANHLITTFAAQTESQNFNFIFSGEDEKQSQWQGLYSIFPLLLFHSLMIIETVIRSFDEAKLEDFDFLAMRAKVGFLLYLQSGTWKIDFRQIFGDFIKSIKESPIPCFGCGRNISLDEENLLKLYWEGMVKCSQCGYTTMFTITKSLFMINHISQGKLTCPNCGSIVLVEEENLRLYRKSQKVICQECKEEIVIAIKE